MIQLPSEPQSGQHISAAWAQQVCRCLKALVPKASRTVLPNIGTGGTTYEVRAQGKPASVAKHNFYFSVAAAGEDLKVTVADGSISGVTPTILVEDEQVPIDTVPAPTATISPTGTVKGWFVLTVEPYAENKGTIAAPKYRIAGGTTTAVEIVFQELAPDASPAEVDVATGDLTNGTYVRRAGTIFNGQVIRPQPVRYSLSTLLCDNGAGLGVLTFGVGL